MYWIRKFKIAFFFTILSFSSGNLFAQEEEKSDCILKLEQAQNKFDQGRIQDIEPLIGQCLEGNKFDKAEKSQALRLLTLAYLFLEELELADGTMLELLKTNHEFKVNSVIDPSEFINLYEKYRHKPIFNIGFLFGFPFASPIITHLNSTGDLNSNSRPEYTPLLGIRAGVYIEHEIFNRFYILGGPGFQIVEFEKIHQLNKIISNSFNGEFNGAEEITSIELPLLAQYHLVNFEKVIMYAGLGFSPQLLINESYQGDATTLELGGTLVSTNKIDLIKDRKIFNVSALATVGLKLKIKEGFVNIQVRYSQQLLNSSNPANSLTPINPDLIWNLNESYDGFKLQDIGFSVGYTRNIYVPKKLR